MGVPSNQVQTPEDEKRSFVMKENGDTTLTLRKRTSRTPQRNIVTHLPGVIREARTYQTPLSFFELFMSNDIIQIILVHTNKEITRRPTETRV